MIRILRIATILFGLAAFAVGVWRQLETGTSPQAAWFGLFTGGMAIAGALLLTGRARILAWLLIVVSLAFESGLFLQRLLTGHAEGKSVRCLLILTFCAIEAILLVAAAVQTLNQWRRRNTIPTG
ncbi:MAG: hypothetical protein WCN95_15225 [bacterium]